LKAFEESGLTNCPYTCVAHSVLMSPDALLSTSQPPVHHGSNPKICSTHLSFAAHGKGVAGMLPGSDCPLLLKDKKE
jgi:hypothetical protein